MTDLTQEKLKELLSYNPDTGLFIRVHDRRSDLVGAVAGYVDSKRGYIRISIKGKNYLAHRLAFLYMTGEWCVEGDHINHIRDDNRWSNLRDTSTIENGKNLSIAINNTTGVTGLSWDKVNKKWVAQIKISGVQTHIGRYASRWDAICARKSKEAEVNFHSNHGVKRKVIYYDNQYVKS